MLAEAPSSSQSKKLHHLSSASRDRTKINEFRCFILLPDLLPILFPDLLLSGPRCIFFAPVFILQRSIDFIGLVCNNFVIGEYLHTQDMIQLPFRINHVHRFQVNLNTRNAEIVRFLLCQAFSMGHRILIFVSCDITSQTSTIVPSVASQTKNSGNSSYSSRTTHPGKQNTHPNKTATASPYTWSQTSGDAVNNHENH